MILQSMNGILVQKGVESMAPILAQNTCFWMIPHAI